MGKRKDKSKLFKSLTITLEPTLFDRLNRYSIENNMGKAKIISNALMNYFRLNN